MLRIFSARYHLAVLECCKVCVFKFSTSSQNRTEVVQLKSASDNSESTGRSERICKSASDNSRQLGEASAHADVTRLAVQPRDASLSSVMRKGRKRGVGFAVYHLARVLPIIAENWE